MSEFFDLHDDPSLRRVLFLGAVLLILVPLLQAGAQLYPLQLSNIQWRFQAANALSAVLLLPFLGLSLLLLMSRALESRSMARAAAILASVFAAGLAASFVVFILDALQLKTIVSTAMESQFKASAARVAIVTAMFVVAYLMVALAGFSTPRTSSRTAARSEAPRRSREPAPEEPGDESPGLIVGR